MSDRSETAACGCFFWRLSGFSSCGVTLCRAHRDVYLSAEDETPMGRLITALTTSIEDDTAVPS